MPLKRTFTLGQFKNAMASGVAQDLSQRQKVIIFRGIDEKGRGSISVQDLSQFYVNNNTDKKYDPIIAVIAYVVASSGESE